VFEVILEHASSRLPPCADSGRGRPPAGSLPGMSKSRAAPAGWSYFDPGSPDDKTEPDNIDDLRLIGIVDFLSVARVRA
jgi:hypothetical protein